jgi:sensor domain CHASE-containing protein
MDEKYGVVATPVLHLMKKSIKRTYILLVLFIALFVISIVDSIYQRCRIIRILEELETVEKVIETECNEDVET